MILGVSAINPSNPPGSVKMKEN